MSIEAEYLRILATVEPGTRFTIDDLEPAVTAAQLTRYERGEIMRFGVREGLLTTRHITRTSLRASRRHARVQIYTRTRKRVTALTVVSA